MSEQSIGLALGGGGARGLAHIHVLYALEDLGLKPARLAGTSIGSMMAAGVAAGLSAGDIEEFVLTTFTDRKEVLSRFWRMRPGGISEIIAPPRTFLGNLDAMKAIRAFRPDGVPDLFSDLKLPLSVVATDFYGQCEVLIEEGDLVEAIAASSALPAVFHPVDRLGVALVDGGIVNSVPYEHLQGKVDIVIAVDVVGGPKHTGKKAPSRVEALFGASQLMMQATTKFKVRISPPDAFIVPPVSGIGVLDFLKARTILEATSATRDMAKREIEAALTRKEDNSQTVSAMA